MTTSITYFGTTFGLFALATLLSQVDAGLVVTNGGSGSSKQSPIDIKEQDTQVVIVPISMKTCTSIDPSKTSSITFNDYATPLDFVMRNEGDTVKVYLNNTEVIPLIQAPYVSEAEFKFSHFLFHWGGKNTVGSEHLFDGIAAPLEVQLVHFNTKYGKTIEDVLASEDASDKLIVLGALFDIIPCSVKAFDPFINKLKEVGSPGLEAKVTGLKLEDLLPTDKKTFFSYEGSLTMPRCEQVVAWTVFK
ncbi:Carbonic anhydrase 3, partial [Caligus rogercresseyi]